MLFLCPIGVRKAQDEATATAIRNGSGEASSPCAIAIATGARDDRGGGVVQHVRQRHRHHHQRGQHHPGRQPRRSASSRAVGDQLGAARGFQRRAERDHRAEQHDHRPFDMVVELGQRQDAQQRRRAPPPRPAPPADRPARGWPPTTAAAKMPMAAQVLPSWVTARPRSARISPPSQSATSAARILGHQQQQDVAGPDRGACAPAWSAAGPAARCPAARARRRQNRPEAVGGLRPAMRAPSGTTSLDQRQAGRRRPSARSSRLPSASFSPRLARNSSSASGAGLDHQRVAGGAAAVSRCMPRSRLPPRISPISATSALSAASCSSPSRLPIRSRRPRAPSVRPDRAAAAGRAGALAGRAGSAASRPAPRRPARPAPTTAPTGAKSNIAERLAQAVLRIVGDDDVGRGADQRRPCRRGWWRSSAASASARDGARPCFAAWHVDRHQQRQRRDVVHERRQQRRRPRPSSRYGRRSAASVSISVRVISSTAPERTSPAETTSTSATIIVAAWPKPAKA